ncbi:hypothetical protein [Corynebacterium glyciniphilum]|uniref:hypothetical protein n=1 Tax=Corynebacterium glyciniphilum TaxID=1404244 RepID=UPI0026550FDE|nr:hypothetical protein [Corynebacterium glyciniphilum]MDN6706406.1 hypothetical protein [Corynebacterium glyciniphilum]
MTTTSLLAGSVKKPPAPGTASVAEGWAWAVAASAVVLMTMTGLVAQAWHALGAPGILLVAAITVGTVAVQLRINRHHYGDGSNSREENGRVVLVQGGRRIPRVTEGSVDPSASAARCDRPVDRRRVMVLAAGD